MNKTKELVYSPISLNYDKDRVKNELIEIEPQFKELYQAQSVLNKFFYLNKDFKLVNDQDYKNITTYDNETKSAIKGNYSGWFGISLIKSKSIGEIPANSSTGIRNSLPQDCYLDEKFSNYYFYKVIKDLPFEKLYAVRVVKLNKGDFAPIHRDNGAYSLPNQEGTSSNNNSNELWRLGKIRSLTLNIENGKTPLLFRYDGEIISTNDSDYIFNDYYLHGVPVAKAERYQIIITGKPNENFDNLVQDVEALYDN